MLVLSLEEMTLDDTTAAMSALSVVDKHALIGTGDNYNEQKGSTTPHPAAQSTEDATKATRYPKNLLLDIGGRMFKVARNTLESESGLFRSQLSSLFTWTPEPDGSYFLDADPDLFEHLLRYMRRPEVFPLFYSVMNGFDYDLYNRLQAEALYFQIKKLYEWIEAKVLVIL